MRHLHLIWPAPAEPEAMRQVAPNLYRLTRCARTLEAADLARAGCVALGVERQQDWPLAPLLAAAAGLDARSGYWLCMDPVAFDIGMNGLTLRRPQPLSEADMAQLLQTLAAEGREWGGEFHAPTPERCFWRLPAAPQLLTRPADALFDQTLPANWMEGAQAAAFQRVLNATQIALHQLPFNPQREAAGHWPIGGLWPWGGGVWPAMSSSPEIVWGGGGIARALAEVAGAMWQPLPTRCPELSGRADGLAWLPPADPAELERDWFTPLLGRLRWGRLQRLTLSLTGPIGHCYSLTPRDIWFR